MSKKRGTNVPDQPTVPPMPKRRRYIDESILVEKLHVGEGLQTISRSVLVNCVLPTIPTADVRENVRGEWLPHPNKQNKEWDICSACGKGCKRREFGMNDDGSEWMTEYSFSYCPNCGAQMIRGES